MKTGRRFNRDGLGNTYEVVRYITGPNGKAIVNPEWTNAQFEEAVVQTVPISECVPIPSPDCEPIFFSQCCLVPVADSQKTCPKCGNLVIGHEAATDFLRHCIRFNNASRLWPYRSNTP